VDEEGNKDRRGPWNEQEEARQNEEWKASSSLFKRDDVDFFYRIHRDAMR